MIRSRELTCERVRQAAIFYTVYLSDAWLSRARGFRARRGLIDDRRANQVAPLRPRAVVILHVIVAEQIFQHEPCMRAALADAAIGDHFVIAVDPLPPIQGR